MDLKYFFMVDTAGKRHILVAKDESQANRVVAESGLKPVDLYELRPDTFKEPGFLISG